MLLETAGAEERLKSRQWQLSVLVGTLFFTMTHMRSLKKKLVPLRNVLEVAILLLLLFLLRYS